MDVDLQLAFRCSHFRCNTDVISVVYKSPLIDVNIVEVVVWLTGVGHDECDAAATDVAPVMNFVVWVVTAMNAADNVAEVTNFAAYSAAARNVANIFVEMANVAACFAAAMNVADRVVGVANAAACFAAATDVAERFVAVANFAAYSVAAANVVNRVVEVANVVAYSARARNAAAGKAVLGTNVAAPSVTEDVVAIAAEDDVADIVSTASNESDNAAIQQVASRHD